MPIAVSPASKIPGVNFARGSLTSEPVIPGGSGCAGSGANGSVGSSLVASCDGDGDGDGVCAMVAATKHEHKTNEAINKRKAISCTRLIVSPLKILLPDRKSVV